MLETLFDNHALGAFLLASLLLAVSPGPGVIFVVTQTLRQGRNAGLASIAGLALGNLVNASAASLGLAALFAASSAAFVLVKTAGALYLVYLGLKVLLTPVASAAGSPTGQRSARRLFRDGFFVALLNPKTTLFFAALLPQFVDTARPALVQTLTLGGLFVLIAACTDTIYALSASVLSPALGRRSGWGTVGRYVSAATFFGLGIYAALGNPRATK